jgi:hypothetical protein
VIQQEYAIHRPFEIHFRNDQLVKKIDQDGNGNVVVYIEPMPGSPTPTGGSPTLISATPTPKAELPTPTAWSPMPTAVGTGDVPTSTQEMVLTPQLGLSDPVEFIHFYFSNINARNYPLTWSLLSEDFINRMNSPAQGGYQGYVDYWNTARSVDIIEVVVESQNASSARVNVNMTVHYEDGRTITWYQHFSLIYEHARDTWLFDG